MGQDIPYNNNKKIAELVILISDKIFKNVRRELKELHDD